MTEATSSNYELVILLATAYNSLIESLHLRLAQTGFDDVRPIHGFVFQLLSFNPSNGNQIAEYLGVSKQAASQMMEYLEQHGYIVRQPDPHDRRGKVVALTARGWECIRQVEAYFTSLEQQWNEAFGSAKVEGLRSSLREIVLQLGQGRMLPRFRPLY